MRQPKRKRAAEAELAVINVVEIGCVVEEGWELATAMRRMGLRHKKGKKPPHLTTVPDNRRYFDLFEVARLLWCPNSPDFEYG